MFCKEEMEINGDTFCLTAVVYFEFDIEAGLNADIGGIDGPEVSFVTIVGASLDGFALSHDDLIKSAGSAWCVQATDEVFDTISGQLRCGDDIEAVDLPTCLATEKEV